MKKLISLITIIALLLTFLTVFASCGGAPRVASVEKTSYKDVIVWSYDADTKTLKIENKGTEPAEMPAFAQASELPWYSLRTYTAKLELSGISKISDYAFYGMYSIKEIVFGSDVKEIGKCAFAFCTSITEAVIPNGVTTIGESAFEGCANLKTVKLPASVKSIGERAFAYDHSLTDLHIEQGFLNALSTESFNSMLQGIPQPTITTFAVNENGEKVETPDSTEESTEKVTEGNTEAATESSTEAATDSTETEAPAPQDSTTTVIAIVILVLVIIGLIVGGILLARSNKKITKDSRTVRKNDPKYNKNSNSKGKKK